MILPSIFSEREKNIIQAIKKVNEGEVKRRGMPSQTQKEFKATSMLIPAWKI